MSIAAAQREAGTMTHKPTAEECRIIRACARQEAGAATIRVEAGERVLLDATGDAARNINVRLLVDDDHMEGTDLFDHVDWATFRKFGFEMAEGGRALVDFYVYTTGHWGELQGNVTAYWESGRLEHVKATGGHDLWRRKPKDAE
jgi:hypothetical protein